jgi:uncharacterized protein YuzE
MPYLDAVDTIADGSVETTLEIEADALRADLSIDLDASGQVLGIEIYETARQLRPETLARAEPPGGRPPVG